MDSQRPPEAALLDVVGDGLIIWDADGAMVSCNQRAESILGVTHEQLARLTFDQLMRAVARDMDPVAEDGTPLALDQLPVNVARERDAAVTGSVIGVLREDGSRYWIEIDAAPMHGPSGTQLVTAFRDVTALREARAEARLHDKLLEAIGQPVTMVDPERNIVYWNDAATALFGWTRDEAVGGKVLDVVDIVGGAEALDRDRDRLLAGNAVTHEFRVHHREGHLLHVIVTRTPVFDDHGALLGIIAVVADVTARAEAEEHRRSLSAIVESSVDAIIGEGLDGTIESWNAGAAALFQYTAAEIIGRDVTLLIPEGERRRLQDVIEHVRAGMPIENIEVPRLRKDGSTVHVSLTASPVHDPDGNLSSISVIARDVSELVAAREALTDSEARFRALVQRSSDVAFIFDDEGVIQYASPAVARLGYTPEELLDTNGWLLVHPDDLAAGHSLLTGALERGEMAWCEWRIRTKSGEWRWFEETVINLTDEPAVGGVVANLRDITDRRLAEEQRREAERRYVDGFEKSAFGLALLDLTFAFTSVNPALEHLLGHAGPTLVSRPFEDFLHPDEAAAVRRGMQQLLGPGAPPFHRAEHRIRRADGADVWVVLDMTVVRDTAERPSSLFVQVADMTDRKRAEEALAHQALHDTLTDLPNRLLLVDRLSQSLARAERTDANVAVLFLDLDRFKLVNDSLGHEVGDRLLVEVAARLTRTMRGSDTVARFGGDEFVLVCEEVRDAADARELAERAIAVLADPIFVSGRELYATASVGVAVGDANSSAEQLLRDADAAMYRAKDLGRARVEVFSQALRRRVAARLDLETALRQAVDRDELRLVFQPVVRLADGEVVGAEALLRWERPGHGLVLPGEFIPAAEETGLIIPIGEWALEHALASLERLTGGQRLDPKLPLLAVNLSALQLRLPTSIDMVRDALAGARVAPGMLSLEITESALMDDIETSVHALAAMRDLGVHLAIDDFGTGYSSLTYLKRLPIDALKIDRSFVDGLPDEPHDRFITEAIVTLGRSLQLTLVAEGVETVAQWDTLDELGCGLGQGFLWSEPVSVDEFARLRGANFSALRHVHAAGDAAS